MQKTKNPPKKKQWYEGSGSMQSKLMKNSQKGMPLRKSNASGIGDALEVPQRQATKMITGKYETPGQALQRKGVVKNKTALDVVDFVADPINALPIVKGAKYAYKTLKGTVSGTKALSRGQKIYNKSTKALKAVDNIYDVKGSRTISKKK